MTQKQFIKTEVEERVATLTVDRPPVNSFNSQVVAELTAALDELLADDQVKAIIITGTGEKAFIAGAHIPEIQVLLDQPEEGYRAAREFVTAGQRMTLKVEAARKPVIAAINGFCLGGGLELAMACHIRVASEKAQLGQPEIALGLIPGWGGTQRLPRIVGKGRAIEMILTGEAITAQEAYRIGLVNRVVPAEESVLEEAKALARQIASMSQLPTAATLLAVDQGLKVGLEEGLAIEADQFVALVASEDVREGIDAFLSRPRREPEFKDR